MRLPLLRAPRRYVIVTMLAVLATLSGYVAPWAVATLMNTSAKDRIAADPPPRLFPDATVAPIGRQIDAQAPEAAALMSKWWAAHGVGRSDTPFTAWLERTLPGPPSPAQRSTEMRLVQALAKRRTPQGVNASTWLESYGKKDVWKLYAHDQAEMLPAGVGDARKNDTKDLLSMTKTVADALGARYRQPAPYVLHPELRPDHHVTPGQVCPCSYPSRHATAAAAARTYLSALEPHRATDYRWMEAQVAYSRTYMAGHVPSDITGGALLGDMIGEYFLVTRAHFSEPNAARQVVPGHTGTEPASPDSRSAVASARHEVRPR